MIRGKICIAIGAFIIGTALMFNSNKPQVYEKKMCFNSPEEIIEVLNNNPISSLKEQYSHEIVYSDKYLECLSNRKRTTIGVNDLDVADLDLHINEDKENEEFKNNLKYTYKVKANRLEDYNISDDIEGYNLVGKFKNVYKTDMEGDMDLDVVFIKEGEGWVIDYIVINSSDYPN